MPPGLLDAELWTWDSRLKPAVLCSACYKSRDRAGDGAAREWTSTSAVQMSALGGVPGLFLHAAGMGRREREIDAHS